MSQRQITETRCDLCGHGGPLSRPHDFKSFGAYPFDVDLCRFCADPTPKAWLETGRHRVEFTDDSWSCSCGAVYTRLLFVLPRVRDAVPNMLNATAFMHVHRD